MFCPGRTHCCATAARSRGWGVKDNFTCKMLVMCVYICVWVVCVKKCLFEGLFMLHFVSKCSYPIVGMVFGFSWGSAMPE